MDNLDRSKNQAEINVPIDIRTDQTDLTFDDILGERDIDPYNKARWQIADSVYDAKHAVEVMRMFMNVNLKQMEELVEARKEALAKGHAAGVAETQARYEEVLAAKDAALASKDIALASKDDEIARLRAELAAATQR